MAKRRWHHEKRRKSCSQKPKDFKRFRAVEDGVPSRSEHGWQQKAKRSTPRRVETFVFERVAVGDFLGAAVCASCARFFGRSRCAHTSRANQGRGSRQVPRHHRARSKSAPRRRVRRGSKGARRGCGRGAVRSRRRGDAEKCGGRGEGIVWRYRRRKC